MLVSSSLWLLFLSVDGLYVCNISDMIFENVHSYCSLQFGYNFSVELLIVLISFETHIQVLATIAL